MICELCWYWVQLALPEGAGQLLWSPAGHSLHPKEAMSVGPHPSKNAPNKALGLSCAKVRVGGREAAWLSPAGKWASDVKTQLCSR